MENEDTGRSRRTKSDKTGRFAALDKLKALKGTKNKYDFVEEEPVYDEISEKEYSKLVQERQEDDWIIGDDKKGYIEDGREIFDEDIEDDANVYTDKKSKQNVKKNQFAGPEKRNAAKSGNIMNIFKSMPTKRKNENEVKLEDDDILGSIMENLHKETDSQNGLAKPMVLRKKHKFTHPSPVQRYTPHSLTPKVKTPLASDYVPARQSKPLQAKVVNFNKALEEEEVKENDDVLDIGFDPSGDIFDDDDFEEEETLPIKHTEASSKEDVPEVKMEFLPEVETKPESKKPKPVEPNFNTSSFQGTMSDYEEKVSDVYIDSASLPLTKTADGKSVFRFFWLDAFEDPYKHPGVVYLFGKVFVQEANCYASCCVVVKDVPRRFFVLPRETEMNTKTKTDTEKPVTMQSVYSEISSILEKMKISEFRSKKSSKRYCFSVAEIPDVCEYLEIQYSAQSPHLPNNLSGSTFSHVLSADSSSLEHLLIEQNIKGPCWIDVQFPQPVSPPISWCKFEVFVTKMNHIVCATDVSSVPPVVLMSLSLTTTINSQTQQSEIVAVSCLVHHNFPIDKTAPSPQYQSYFTVLTNPSDAILPHDFAKKINDKNTTVQLSERSLLTWFLTKIQKLDPDVIVGHDILGLDLDVLLHRMVVLKIPNWSRIGKLRRTGVPCLSTGHSGRERNATCGRLLCDVKISSKELIRSRSYDLEELVMHILNKKYAAIQTESVLSHYGSSMHLFKLIDHGLQRSEHILAICCELNVLPLALQITNIAGCVMSRTLLGGRSERNEYLLLHAFHAKNFIYPPKYQGKKNQASNDGGELELTSKKGKKKPSYEGGLVLEPKKGFYDKFILLMDFNSLYPSIIQEYNICFTTLPRVSANEEKDEVEIDVPESGLKPGILRTEIGKLVERRRQVKQMMKEIDTKDDKYAQYDIRQKALKLTANSMYGCLGFTHSRFYAKPLAALITRKGREILLKTKELVEKEGLDVIYGDTDSIMINTNQTKFDSVMEMGNKVKTEINRSYRYLEIDIDGVYKPMLLLKKKKYAALSVTFKANGEVVTKKEVKGLDVVRRDWSKLAQNAGQYVIDQILSSESKDEIVDNIHSHLIQLGEDVTQGKKPLGDYEIYKQLTKNPEEYADRKNLPHVLVACRINEKGGTKMKMGDTVRYIVCLDGTDLPATQRAYHIDELKSTETLKIDVSYYLAHQIHPVVSRLCGPIEGADSAMIAKLLGLDASKYQSILHNVEEDDDKLLNPSTLFDDKDRFKNCDRLVLRCPTPDCFQDIIIDSTLRTESYSFCQLVSCLKCKTKLFNHCSALRNQLEKIMKSYISKYYQQILVCEDVGCAYESKNVPLVFTSDGPQCPYCQNSTMHLTYSESQLYSQLSYFQVIFDLPKAESDLSDKEKLGLKITEEDKELYRYMKISVDKIIRKSDYGIVNLNLLFQGLYEDNTKERTNL